MVYCNHNKIIHIPFSNKRTDKMLALEELLRALAPYRARLVEMGDSL
jgi:hypothetical protein